MTKHESKIIHDILTTFFFTTNLSIICTDSKIQILDSVGIELSELEKLKIAISNKISYFSNKNKSVNFITLTDSLEIAIIFISSGTTINNYFLIGPYHRTPIDKKDYNLFQYRPKSCINYLITILQTIIKNKTSFSSKHSDIKINLHTKKAIQFIHKNYDNELTIDFLSKELNINKCYFCNIFKKDMNITFSSFLNKFRIEKSKSLLSDYSLSILDVAISVGFNNQNYYSMAFKKETGITPLQYRKSLIVVQ